jgi:peptidoglycan/xylan/chitin deacetylase (PgdA/CDA1 family)
VSVRTVRVRGRVLALLKECAYVLLRVSGAAALVRVLAGRNRVAILVYHHPAPETLERHLAYLCRVGTVIPLDALVDALSRRDFSTLPRGSVVITIDDGHRSNWRLLDVFDRYGVSPTIYACSQIVGTGRRFWWTVPDRRRSRELKRVPNADRLAELRDRYRFSDRDEGAEPQALSAVEMRELARYVDFEAHTRFHPILTRCALAEAEEEVIGSKVDLEAFFGRPCRHFAYPNGDYGEREIEIVRAAGFASARTIDPGWNGPNADPYRLRILGIADDASVTALAAHLAGLQVLRRALTPFRRLPRLRPSREPGLDIGHGRPA